MVGFFFLFCIFIYLSTNAELKESYLPTLRIQQKAKALLLSEKGNGQNGKCYGKGKDWMQRDHII